jgi:hypothetical protein
MVAVTCENTRLAACVIGDAGAVHPITTTAFAAAERFKISVEELDEILKATNSN